MASCSLAFSLCGIPLPIALPSGASRLNSAVAFVPQAFKISDPPAMVEDTEHLLIDEGVDVKNIRIDSFGGY